MIFSAHFAAGYHQEFAIEMHISPQDGDSLTDPTSAVCKEFDELCGLMSAGIKVANLLHQQIELGFGRDDDLRLGLLASLEQRRRIIQDQAVRFRVVQNLNKCLA